MKHTILSALLFFMVSCSFAQKLPYPGYWKNFLLPDAVNGFIQSRSINWAMDAEETFSFADAEKYRKENIFDYLVLKALSGKVKAYHQRYERFEGFENAPFSGVDTLSDNDKINMKHSLTDSLKNIGLHEIFYLDNYQLKCKIVSVAPMTNFVTGGGINLGVKPVFRCCKNNRKGFGVKNKNSLIHLKKLQRVFYPDSVNGAAIIKQNYGLNLVQAIWIGAAKGAVKLLDTELNRVIAAGDVLNYQFFTDSIQVPVYDKEGKVTGKTLAEGTPVFSNKLVNAVQFVQDFYYDPGKQIFISTITDCYLLVKSFDNNTYESRIEKRFRIL